MVEVQGDLRFQVLRAGKEILPLLPYLDRIVVIVYVVEVINLFIAGFMNGKVEAVDWRCGYCGGSNRDHIAVTEYRTRSGRRELNGCRWDHGFNYMRFMFAGKEKKQSSGTGNP